MRNMSRMLPVFSPDFCGVMSVFLDTDALQIFHGQGGCVGNFAYGDEIRWQESNKKLLVSRISEAETVVGSDESFIEKAVSAIKTDNSKLAVVISSPIAMVTGIDICALANVIEKKTGIPVLGINAHGFKTYEYGQELAYEQLYYHFLEKKEKGEKENTAVVIGATSLDGFDNKILDEYQEFLLNLGYDEVLVWGMRSGISDVERTKDASRIYVVSKSGIKVAKMIQERFGIPYSIGIPVGNRFSGQLEIPEKRNEKTLVLADQVTACSVREYLEKERGMQHVTVASMFTMCEELNRPGDKFISCEDELMKYGMEEEFDYIVADKLYEKVISAKKKFICLPHTAVSGWVNTEKLLSIIGKNAENVFSEINDIHDAQ